MRIATLSCAIFTVMVLSTGGAIAAEPEPAIPDCLEGAGDDLKSVNWEDLKFPPPEAPTS